MIAEFSEFYPPAYILAEKSPVSTDNLFNSCSNQKVGDDFCQSNWTIYTFNNNRPEDNEKERIDYSFQDRCKYFEWIGEKP